MEEFDVIIIGSGAGLNIADPALNSGLEVALVENGPLGGTCLNRGCIPSKMWIYPADVVREIEEGAKLGVHARVEKIDFDLIRRRTWDVVLGDRGHIEEAVKVDPRLKFYHAEGRFVGDHALKVGDAVIHAPKIVLAAGARSYVPPIPGLDGVRYRTSEDIFDITALPRSIIMIGGGYKSCEFAHFFSAMGVKVSIIQRNIRLVPDEEPEMSFVVRKRLGEHVDISVGQTVREVRNGKEGIEVVREDRETENTFTERAEMLFVATGMQSNADLLNVNATGVETDPMGYVKVNEFLETTAPGIWAMGDITGLHMFRHTANYESQVVWYNMTNTEKAATDEHAIPHAIYTYPTVGSVGMTEAQAKAGGFKYLTGYSRYANVAKGNAMADDTGLVKMVVEKGTRRILGAHIAGKEADLLVQQVVYLMNAGDMSYTPMARSQVIHPALSEVLISALGRLSDPEHLEHEHVHTH
ncbi:MAG: dihydrolipoyl dehydrogenase [Methanomassiliicoccus sp.]|nr:dihydrolipoyl dehydrogenase [Methanomassiliicoccus sp.]